MGQGSTVWVKVMCQGSKLKGQGSRVKGTTLLTLPPLILRLSPPLTPPPMAWTRPQAASDTTPNPTLSTTPKRHHFRVTGLGLQRWCYRDRGSGVKAHRSGAKITNPLTLPCPLLRLSSPLTSLHTPSPVAPLTTLWAPSLTMPF